MCLCAIEYAGTRPPVIPTRRKRKGLFICIAAAVIVVAGIITALLLLKPGILSDNNGLAVTINETSFSTPEAAIKHFISSISANDLNGALAACAINESTQDYNVEAEIDRLQAISPPALSPAPTQYKFYKAFNQTYFLSRITSQILYFTYSFEDSDVVKTVVGGDTYTSANSNDAAKFVKAVNPGNIKGLSIVRIDNPSPEILNSAQNIKNFKIQADIYGADELTERVALYKLNGKYYYGGFQLLRYNKSWKIIDLTSSVAGTSASGAVQRTTVDAYSAPLK
jgi:hypothetical protein